MESTTTKDVVDFELSRLLRDIPVPSSTTDRQLPVVFMMHTSGVHGDQRPFFQMIHELTSQMPGAYCILVCTAMDPDPALRQLVRDVSRHVGQPGKGSVTFYGWSAIDEWIKALQQAVTVDAVVTNQHANLVDGQSEPEDKLRWYRLYEAAKQKNALLTE